MKTEHKTIFADSTNMKDLFDESVDLIVTSPPYPMIEMWDDMFKQQDPSIEARLDAEDGMAAFELMHKILDQTWKEAYRVLKTGGFACINIGDATRTIKGDFKLYPNHSRILQSALEMGFSSLPCIIWRKQTNAPNKFMGSGMLPAGAYITLEHEYILILRKGSKRNFSKEIDKKNRRGSALFWEERNLWFSDIWFDIKGTPQALKDKDTRKRSAAYPFDLAYRLINMYSSKNDLVLDPFLGMGTTTLAAMASARNSVGYEIENSLQGANKRLRNNFIQISQEIIGQRLINHIDFVHNRTQDKGVSALKHRNIHYGFPVMTAQEKELLFNNPEKVDSDNDRIVVNYSDSPQTEFCRDWSEYLKNETISPAEQLKVKANQLTLF